MGRDLWITILELKNFFLKNVSQLNVHNSRILIVSCYPLCLSLDTNPEKPSEVFILPKLSNSQ